jgi:hypothetical protein
VTHSKHMQDPTYDPANGPVPFLDPRDIYRVAIDVFMGPYKAADYTVTIIFCSNRVGVTHMLTDRTREFEAWCLDHNVKVVGTSLAGAPQTVAQRNVQQARARLAPRGLGPRIPFEIPELDTVDKIAACFGSPKPDCPECWGTGYFKGYGGPCSRGCK